jgi:hypothetical protein
MSDQTKASILCVIAILLGILCSGCANRSQANRVNYSIQTRCPDIWSPEPTQEISIKMDFRR